MSETTGASGTGAQDTVPVARSGGPAWYLVPLVGVIGVLLTVMALSGGGDAPAPYDEPASMAAYFQTVRDDVLFTAPMGTLGAAAMAAFLLALARRLHAAGEPGAATAVVAGGVVTVGYFLVVYVIDTALVYQVAVTSPEATKALFVLTIVAAPVLGLGVAVTLGGAAYGAARSGLLPRWWTVASVVGAAIAAIAIFSYARNEFFSPDVQQQTAGNGLFVWLLLTAGTLFVRSRRERRP